jgi:hypothetical protein
MLSMPQFLNQYHCVTCDVEWSDQWSATCDDKCPQCGAAHSPVSSTIQGLDGLKPFEIQAAGFDGNGDTDDRIIWIAAANREAVEVAIDGLGAKLGDIDAGLMEDMGDSIDFVLPDDLEALRQRLGEFAAKAPQVTQTPVTTHRTSEFLSSIDPEMRAKILNSIAKHYGTTPDVILNEITGKDAEHLLDYMVEPLLRSETSSLMLEHGMRGW